MAAANRTKDHAETEERHHRPDCGHQAKSGGVRVGLSQLTREESVVVMRSGLLAADRYASSILSFSCQPP